jgi:hypothetical protein
MVVKAEPELGTPGGVAVSGDAKSTSFVIEPLDPNPDLHFPASIPIYDEMRTTDGQVGSLISAINLPILAARWQLQGANVRPEVLKFVQTEIGLNVADEALERRRGNGIVWLDHLETALLALPFGFMPFEQVYEAGPPAPGQEDVGVPTLLHLRKLAPRLPRTVTNIFVGRDGGLAGIGQAPLDPKATKDVFIPVDRLVFYCHKREGADWSGRSILRTIYKNWMIGDKILRLSAQIIERNGMQVPVIYYNPDKMPKSEADLIAQNFRAGATAAASIPDGGGKLELVGGGSSGAGDALEHMKYHDEKIAESALAMFKTLGHDSGARSLGDTFVDIFTQAVQSIANYFAGVATEHIIRDLVEINFGPDEPYPVLTAGDLSANRAITSSALKELVDAGIIRPDQKLEDFMRAANGLPAADAATIRAEVDAIKAAVDPAEEALKKANFAGTMIRSGFDPMESATVAGLPEVKHLGLLPVTLQPPAAGTDLENAVDPTAATAGPQAPAAPAAPAQLAEGDPHPKLSRLEAIMAELASYRAGQHVS